MNNKEYTSKCNNEDGDNYPLPVDVDSVIGLELVPFVIEDKPTSADTYSTEDNLDNENN